MKAILSLILLLQLTIESTRVFSPPSKALQDTKSVEIPSSLADNPTKREQLKYLVSCALAEGTNAYAKVDGKKYSFTGNMGLASNWLNKGLTFEEKRWVSACMLARTNFFGKTVQISMRVSEEMQTLSENLKATPEEIEEYSIFEGGFFGNLFSENPVAYTCLGNRTAEENIDPILQARVCTEETGIYNTNKLVSRCGFIITGQCSDPESFVVGDEVYEEVIFIYLKPKQSKVL